MSKLFGVYGQLRRNHSQYDELGGQRMLCFRGIYRIPGYKMYSYNDEYPVVVHTHKKEDKVIMEVFITPDETSNKIILSETQKDFQEFTISITEDKVSVFLFKGNVDNLQEVPNGDWALYLKTLKPKVEEVIVSQEIEEQTENPNLKVEQPELTQSGTTTQVVSEPTTELSKPVVNKVKLTIEDMKSLLTELNKDYLAPKDLMSKFNIVYDKAKYFLDKFLIEKNLMKETIKENEKNVVVYKLINQ